MLPVYISGWNLFLLYFLNSRFGIDNQPFTDGRKGNAAHVLQVLQRPQGYMPVFANLTKPHRPSDTVRRISPVVILSAAGNARCVWAMQAMFGDIAQKELCKGKVIGKRFFLVA